MPSTSRPRGSCGGASSTQRTTLAAPMSERQQMALVMQLTSQENNSASTSAGPSLTRCRERNERGETALHVAAIKGDFDQVKRLLDQGVDPNVVDFAGWTPLHEACSHGWHLIAGMLIHAGADVNARGLDDDTPLHDAAINGQLKIVKCLIESGADPLFKNKKGKMPCDVANPPAYDYLASFQESVSGQRASHAGRSRDDNKKVISFEDSSSSGCSSSIMETATKTSDDKNDSKESSSSGGTEKPVPTTTNTKNNEGDSSSSTISSAVVSSTQEDSSGTNVTQNNKRVLETADSGETEGADDEANKRKKRKETEPVKETAKPLQQPRVNVGRNAIIAGNKPPGPASKTGVAPLSRGGGPVQTSNSKSSVTSGNQKVSTQNNQTKNVTNNLSGTQNKSGPGGAQSGSQPGKTNSVSIKQSPSGLSVTQSNTKGVTDKKSPCASPKPPVFVHVKENDTDVEESKAVDTSGPKVPPLKIVIPGGVGGNGGSGGQQEGESTQRGNTKNRGSTSTLPYIIHFNINSAGETVPVNAEGGDNTTSDTNKDDKRQAGGPDDKAGTGQRVLRSHRNTDGIEKDKERGRSSPHISSSAPPCSPSGAPGPTKTPPPSSANQQAQETESTNQGSSTHHSNASAGASSTSNSSSACHASTSKESSVELHPRKRKIKASKESHSHTTVSNTDTSHSSIKIDDSHTTSHCHPQMNPYQMYLNVKKQIEGRQKSLFPVQPKPPEGFKDYLMNRSTYVLKSNSKQQPIINPPQSLPLQMREEFISQENERHALRVQHLVEKEKLVLAVEQEILRVHGKAARAIVNQSSPFSVCMVMKDTEVYNMLTPEQEEKERNAQRLRYNGRLFLSWLQDVDDKWEKIKEGMVRRHHTEAKSLHATQAMSWEWKLKELGHCDYKTTPMIEQTHVPMVHVSDDFDLLSPE